MGVQTTGTSRLRGQVLLPLMLLLLVVPSSLADPCWDAIEDAAPPPWGVAEVQRLVGLVGAFARSLNVNEVMLCSGAKEGALLSSFVFCPQ